MLTLTNGLQVSPVQAHHPFNLQNDGFLARLHRQLNQPVESISSASLSGSSDHVGRNRWRDDRQRQKQLQRLQNFFGPEVAEAIDQLQDDAPSQPPSSSFSRQSSGSAARSAFVNPLRSDPLNELLAQAESVAHEPSAFGIRQSGPPSFSLPSNVAADQQQPVDALRKYHFVANAKDDNVPSVAVRPLVAIHSNKMLEQMLQEANAESGPEDSMPTARVRHQALVDDSTGPSPAFAFEQLLNSARPYPPMSDDSITDEQLAAMLRHAPLEAILAQAQEEVPHVNKALEAELDPSTNQEAVRAAAAFQPRQTMSKKQAETSEGRADTVSSQADDASSTPQRFKTQLKKVEISQQNGKQLRKEESYEQSVQVSSPPEAKANAELHEEGASGNASPSHMERSAYQVQAPIAVQLRNAPDGSGTQVTRGLTSKLTSFGDLYFLVLVVGCSMASIMSVVGAGICFYRFQQHHKATADVDYPAYGVIGPVSKPPISPGAQQPLQVDLKGKGDGRKGGIESGPGDVHSAGTVGSTAIASGAGDGTSTEAPNGDRKLAQSAQMYHYQHQKQQMIASEKYV